MGAGAGLPRRLEFLYYSILGCPMLAGTRGGGWTIKLLGRRKECEDLSRLLADAFDGRSAVVVVRGEAGVGKSALLAYARDVAADALVATSVGVESEMELAYSGLHQLCAPLLDHLDTLPAPQRSALETVFGLSDGPVPDRFMVGLATLSLFDEAAGRQPLVCIVDDAHWLDLASAQILDFVARRLLAERVAMVCAARTGVGDTFLAGMPELVVGALSDNDALALLLENLHGPLDAVVCDRIVAESHGNPLALLEFPRTWSVADLAGGFGLPAAGPPVVGRIEKSYSLRLCELPSDTQLLILAAAADPVGDPVLLHSAATTLGVELSAADPAIDSGLVRMGARVEFEHPLVRSAAYRSASVDDRRRVHHALAQATDPDRDPDRRAWHRAHAATGFDEDIAVELEVSADRAQARGGVAAASAFLRRAATLTPDPHRRSRRCLAAAAAKRDAGDLDDALVLLTAAENGALDDRAAADVQRSRGHIAVDQGRFLDAVPLLLDAGHRLTPLDPAEARATYLEGLQTAMWLDDLQHPGGMLAAAQAARTAPPAPEPPRLVDVLLDGWAIRLTDGYPAAARLLANAVAQLCSLSTGDDPGRLLWAGANGNTASLPVEVWDVGSWSLLATRHVALAREHGTPVHLQFALNAFAWVQIFTGELDAAARSLHEDRLVAEATGNPPIPWTSPILSSFRGRRRETTALLAAIAQPGAEASGWRRVTHLAQAVLSNGLGHYAEARDAALPSFEHEFIGHPFPVFELAEACSRTGDEAILNAALEAMRERTTTTGGDWATGTQAVIQALLSNNEEAESDYVDAIGRFGRTPLRTYLARTRLLYGEWLRREGRRADAREQLGAAHQMFVAIGMDAFAERARRELLATGEKVRKRSVETRSDLTPQEEQIAGLARDGLSNPEIGAQLFISARTVEWHLRNVFTKLGVSSRRELRAVLPASGEHADRA